MIFSTRFIKVSPSLPHNSIFFDYQKQSDWWEYLHLHLHQQSHLTATESRFSMLTSKAKSANKRHTRALANYKNLSANFAKLSLFISELLVHFSSELVSTICESVVATADFERLPVRVWLKNLKWLRKKKYLQFKLDVTYYSMFALCCRSYQCDWCSWNSYWSVRVLTAGFEEIYIYISVYKHQYHKTKPS